MKRRQFSSHLAAGSLPIGPRLLGSRLSGSRLLGASAVVYPPVTRLAPDQKLQFPRDHGAHADFRMEWWYVTGWLNDAIGYQVTFFRSRTRHSPDNPSRFAPTQLLLAHAALAIPENKALLHTDVAARAHPTLASFSKQDCRIEMRQQSNRWLMERSSNDHYRIQIETDQFQIDLTLKPTMPPWLQGENGFSRKGPLPAQASYYYSRPQIATEGSISYKSSKRIEIASKGVSWFDHEWSSELLDSKAVGWDWLGLNFFDGTAMTIFRVRDKNGDALHDYAAKRNSDGSISKLKPVFRKTRQWTSLRTATLYPVAWDIELAGDLGTFTISIAPLMDDQELDGRRSTGTIYWEGAVEVRQNKQFVGRGYLELTGYHQPLKL
jgi:predicted secreted hydrolase